MLAVAFMACLSGGSWAGELSALSEAYENGELDREQYYMYQLQSIFEPEKLPAQFSSEVSDPERCGTPILMEVRQLWDTFSEEFRAAAAPLFVRPNTQFQYVSPDGYFKLHYDTLTGMETPPVPTEDLDMDSIPDFIEAMAIFADSAWRQIVNNFGYVKPPLDGSLGGDSLYDIYFDQFQYYGVTNGDFAGDSAWDDWASHIVLNRSFEGAGFGPNQDPEGSTIGCMKVAIAHELFHAVQFYYDAYLALWWAEQTAVWMEDQVYPQVHDNYNYFEHFWPVPEVSLIEQLYALHMYGAFVWPQFLTQHVDYDIVKAVTEGMAYPTSSLITVLQNMLAANGTTLNAEFREFLYWNYMTGDRDDGLHYVDAENYPPIDIMRRHYVVPAYQQSSFAAPYNLGSNYIEVMNDSNYVAILVFSMDTAYSAPWGLSYITIDTGGACQYLQGSVTPNGKGRVFVPYFQGYHSAVFIPYVKGTAVGGPYGMVYDVYFRSYGDANDTGEVDIDDVVWIIAYIFSNGPASNPEAAMDANCENGVDIDDVVHLVAYIFSGGPPPCGMDR